MIYNTQIAKLIPYKVSFFFLCPPVLRGLAS